MVGPNSRVQKARRGLVVNEKRRAWEREELIAAFNYYCRIPFGKIHSRNPMVVSLANKLHRTPSAVAMKLVNFASLDPIHKARNVAGLGNVSKADREVWDEYHSSWEKLAFESQSLVEGWGLAKPERDFGTEASKKKTTETMATRRVRMVQSFFREALLSTYDESCAVCKTAIPDVLIASHIIPWSEDIARRADPTNGLLLCALHDRAFDRGLFVVDSTYKITVSDRVRIEPVSELQRVGLIEINQRKINLPLRFLPDKDALEHHRQRFSRN
jgi:putative restriction endonuclease